MMMMVVMMLMMMMMMMMMMMIAIIINPLQSFSDGVSERWYFVFARYVTIFSRMWLIYAWLYSS